MSDYEKVTFERLTEISPDSIIALMNDPAVRRHLPLARGDFGPSACQSFVTAKERTWEEGGFGPWGLVLSRKRRVSHRDRTAHSRPRTASVPG